jgi:hypothetical protein
LEKETASIFENGHFKMSKIDFLKNKFTKALKNVVYDLSAVKPEKIIKNLAA